jgi:hypothetical protein
MALRASRYNQARSRLITNSFVDYRFGFGFHALRLEMSGVNIAKLTNGQLSQLTPNQLNFIVTLLGSIQIDLMAQGQVQVLSGPQIGQLNNVQVGQLTPLQVAFLLNGQLSSLTSSQLQYILASVITAQFLQGNLSPSQKNSLNGVYPLQTGQTTSFLPGDDGDLKHGRLVDFYTLKTDNFFGNTFRLTDENGLQVFQNHYMIDHATGLGWYTVLLGPATWANAIQNANSFSLPTDIGTLTGFALANVTEYVSVLNFGLSNQYMNYVPFNQATQNTLFTSTTFASSTTNAFRVTNGASVNIIGAISKTTRQVYYIVRRHF